MIDFNNRKKCKIQKIGSQLHTNFPQSLRKISRIRNRKEANKLWKNWESFFSEKKIRSNFLPVDKNFLTRTWLVVMPMKYRRVTYVNHGATLKMQNNSVYCECRTAHALVALRFFTISQLGLRFVRESAWEVQFLSFRPVESEIVRGHCTRNLLLHVTRVTVSPGKPLSKASLVREHFCHSFICPFFVNYFSKKTS